MIEPKLVVDTLSGLGVEFATGVPDSLMAPFCTYLATLPPERHLLAANEGAAIGLAVGHYLGTGRPALVYMQNAGIGNAINPLVSLADPGVYGIPMLLLIGWRGQPGTTDEPQHMIQGKQMVPLMEALELPWMTLAKEEDEAVAQLEEALAVATTRSTPYVMLVEKETFEPTAKAVGEAASDDPSREEALIALLDAVGDEGIYVATTGMLGRELYEYRERSGTSSKRDFLTVGGMGHASSIALGLAEAHPEREVWCLDGDGAALMHLGSLAVIANRAPKNFFHVVFDNGVHDSVGGQPTVMRSMDLAAAARAFGYEFTTSISDVDHIGKVVAEMRNSPGPTLIDLRVRPGNRAGIGRPQRSPAEAKTVLMGSLD